jgi:predicted Ser/Thr protein kinase
MALSDPSTVDPSAALSLLRADAAASPLHAACARAATERRLFGRARAPVEIAGRRFEIVRRLGAGGMGVVYEVEDEAGQRLAMKLLRGWGDSGAELLFALKREFRALAGLEHEGLVGFEDLLVDGEEAALTMEFVDGLDFVSAAAAGTGTALAAATVRLAEALRALHAAGLVHRDIKPTNVLVTKAGRVVLLDFGIAGRSGVASDRSGTDTFLAPERRAGAPDAPPADWYAVGVLLARALETLPEAERDPRLARLAAALVVADPAVRADGRTVLSALAGGAVAAELDAGDSSRVDLVGRARELETLLSFARGDGARLALVTAPSGFGKSALVDAFVVALGRREQSTARPTWILRGRCERRELVPNRALDPVIDALSVRWRALDGATAARLVPDDVAALARAFPVVARVPAVAARLADAGPLSDETEPEHARRRAIVALRALLTRAAALADVVVIVDDAQWADEEGRALLDELLRPPSPPPIAVVLASRPRPDGERAGPRQEALERRATVRVTLGPLTPDDAARLVTLLAPSATPERRATIVAHAEGDPFLVRELASLAARGMEAASIAAVLDERLAAVDGTARAVAELLAIATRPIEPAVAAQALALGIGAAGQALRALRAARLARAGVDEDAVTTELVHDRIAEALARRLDDGLRRRLHARLAEALAARPDVDPDVLVHHWANAAEQRRAAALALEAARTAHQRFDYGRAARFLQLAVELDASRDDLPSLRRQLADALARAGRSREAAHAYEAVAAAEPDAEDAARLRRRAAEELLFAGHNDEGLARFDDVLADAGLRRPRTRFGLIADILWTRARIGLRGFRFTERPEAAVSPALLRSIDALHSGMRAFGAIDPIAGYAYASRGLLLALDAGEPGRLACMFAAEALARATTSDGTAEALAADAVELAERSGDPLALAAVYVTNAYGALACGAARRAAEQARRAVALYEQVPVESAAASRAARNCWLTARTALGELDLRDEMEEALRAAEERGDRAGEVMFRLGLVGEAVRSGDVEWATRELADADRRWEAPRFDAMKWTILYVGVQRDLYAGEAAAAIAKIRARWPEIKQSGVMRVPVYRATSWYMRATASLMAGEPPDDARRCAAALRRDRSAIGGASALLLDAIVDAHAGRCEGVTARLIEAARQLDELGIVWTAAAAQRRALELEGDSAKVRAYDAAWIERGLSEPARFLVTAAAPIDIASGSTA